MRHGGDDLEFDLGDEAPASSAQRARFGPWWGRPVRESLWSRELMQLLVDPVFYGVGIPHGDGSSVMLIPGFLAADLSLAAMAGWLLRSGYAPHQCGIRVANVDCSDRALDRLERRVERLAGSEGRALTLVGQSRGGLFARALAARRPDVVAKVVALGSPLNGPFDISVPTRAAVATVRSVLRTSGRARHRGCFTETCTCPFVRDFTRQFPADVAFTSIYTRTDGVVAWQTCLLSYADNIEVTGSHCGLAYNRHAYRHIAHALAAPVRSRERRGVPVAATPDESRLRWDVPQTPGAPRFSRRPSARRSAPVPPARSSPG
ncbi:MAG: esterase/lipase family protein [Frankiaceae bacterium]